MTSRKAIFLSFAFFLFVLVVPRLCAQTPKMSPSEAAVTRQKLVDYSKQFIGKPYASGGIGPNSFDCSGLVFTVSRESIGIQLPRTTKAIYNFCKEIDEETREAGDLVFFKTTSSGNVSHVGLYIGGNQFIHAASDGPNTGVIISSLKESYWKSHYLCTRRYLPASNSELLADSDSTNSTIGEKITNNKQTNDSSQYQHTTVSSGDSTNSQNHSFLKLIIVDASLSVDWSFFTPESFRLNFRGFDSMIHARYAGEILQPGIGTYFRYDAGTGNLQLPFVISLTLNEFFRIFAGPVLALGSPNLPDSTEKIKNSVFPGILGVCFSTPAIKVGKILLSFVQDIHYTVFNDIDGTALSLKNSLATGLVFATGVRVTLPLKNVL